MYFTFFFESTCNDGSVCSCTIVENPVTALLTFLQKFQNLLLVCPKCCKAIDRGYACTRCKAITNTCSLWYFSSTLRDRGRSLESEEAGVWRRRSKAKETHGRRRQRREGRLCKK